MTETLAVGETIEIWHQWEGEIVDGDDIEPGFVFSPTLIEIYEVIPGATETTIDMPFIHELGAKLLEILTGQADPLNAEIIGREHGEPREYDDDSDYCLTAVASGFMIRGFHTADQVLKTSFADYFKSIDALFNLGMWYDQENSEFVIAAKEDFYEVAKDRKSVV